MAGQNLWHKPYFQPKLDHTSKFSISPDRFSWERRYNFHLKRLQMIETRPVYKPHIIKRHYTQDDYRQLSSQNARNFKMRTEINTLPLESRQASPSASPAASPVGSRVGSPAVSRRNSAAKQMNIEDSLRRFTFAAFSGRNASHFPDQDYPIMRRPVKTLPAGSYHRVKLTREMSRVNEQGRRNRFDSTAIDEGSETELQVNSDIGLRW